MPARDDLRRVLRIAPRLRLERIAADVLLLGERERYRIGGASAVVLEQLDGLRTVEAVLERVELPDELMLGLLASLEQRGLITEQREGASQVLAFEDGIAAGPPTSVELGAASDAEWFQSVTKATADALRGAGFELGASGVRVIVTDDYLDPRCLERAEAALGEGRACFLLNPTGLQPWIGPYLRGGPRQPCPRCLAHALAEQRPVERLLARPRPVSRPAMVPASVAAAANLAVLELRKLMAQPEPPARLWSLDLPRFELVEHRVRHRPQCSACGRPSLQAEVAERSVVLRSVAVASAEDGGLRRERPAESFARFRHLISPVLGPVTHLHPMPGRHDETHPVFSSGYLVTPRRPGSGFDRACAGKGCSVEQARMSALAEAIERSSAVHRGDEAVRWASLEELGDEAVELASLQLFSAAQRARGEAPPELDPGTRIAWTPAWSLTEARRRWVPLAYAYTEVPDECGAGYCRPSSNGSAAGNCLEEAILQGLYEAIERDAIAIWWYGRVRRPAAKVPASARAYVERRTADYHDRGWAIELLDLTHDLGVPVFVAVAHHPPSDRLALGFGAHCDAALALRRAISELDQVFDPQASRPSPWDSMVATQIEQLWPDADATAVESRVGLLPDLRLQIEDTVELLRECGLETIVVDKTRPDFGLCVAQVIIPGLRHPWPRFAPGRLYTVPLALGWTQRALSERELHPDPLLI